MKNRQWVLKWKGISIDFNDSIIEARTSSFLIVLCNSSVFHSFHLWRSSSWWTSTSPRGYRKLVVQKFRWIDRYLSLRDYDDLPASLSTVWSPGGTMAVHLLMDSAASKSPRYTAEPEMSKPEVKFALKVDSYYLSVSSFNAISLVKDVVYMRDCFHFF